MRSQLVGKKVKHIAFTPAELYVVLADGTDLVYEAYGDCCSSSYIEDIDDQDVLQDCTVLDIEVVEGRESIDTDEDGYEGTTHKWTFYKFTTNKGRATLSFRNDSNGYYNGYLQLVGE
jgi:hypothetical protein